MIGSILVDVKALAVAMVEINARLTMTPIIRKTARYGSDFAGNNLLLLGVLLHAVLAVLIHTFKTCQFLAIQFGSA